MKIRLIHLTKTRSGAQAKREQSLDVDRLTVGRGTDNLLHIPGLTVSLHHAIFVVSANGVFVERRDASALTINGRPSGGQRVRAGDVVRVGSFELRLIEPAGDEVLALEVEEVEGRGGEADGLARRTVLGVERGLLSRRLLSWAALLVVLGVFLALPFAWRQEHTTVKPLSAGGQPIAIPQAERILNQSWSVGRISQPHLAFGDRCETCHTEGFADVPNAACVAAGCHAGVARHAPAGVALGDLDDARCVECHREHRGDANLILTQDRLCTSCHANLAAKVPQTKLRPVADFASAHPEFRPTVVFEFGKPDRARVDLGPAAAEHSGLRFQHDVHLKPDLRGPKGPETLQCKSCHQLAPDGAMETKISFARDCQRCHRLAFVDADPTREAPHGTPDVVRRAIFETFAARALQALPQDPPASSPMRRRPGVAPDSQREAALTEARRQADFATGVLLGGSGACAQCHLLGEQGEEPCGAEAFETWFGALRVTRVYLTPISRGDRWLPLARFSHEPHRGVPCTDCHAAETAHSAEIVLMPSIDKCRQCHGGERTAAGRIASPCLSCHQFHDSALGPMVASRMGPGAAESSR
jgi:predicted CXXCH cytochrome family protein